MKHLFLAAFLIITSTSHAQMSQEFECLPYSNLYGTNYWRLVITDPDLPSFYLTSPIKQTSQGSMGTSATMDYSNQCQRMKFPYRFSVNAYPHRGDFCCREK